MTQAKKIDLLIREIDPKEKNGRYLRENLRRIKQFLDDVANGTNTLVNIQNQLLTLGFNYSEQYDVTVLNQTVFPLLNSPAEPSKVRMTINGVEAINGTHFTVVGNVATFNPIAAGYILEAVNELGQPDKIVFQYIISA